MAISEIIAPRIYKTESMQWQQTSVCSQATPAHAWMRLYIGCIYITAVAQKRHSTSG